MRKKKRMAAILAVCSMTVFSLGGCQSAVEPSEGVSIQTADSSESLTSEDGSQTAQTDPSGQEQSDETESVASSNAVSQSTTTESAASAAVIDTEFTARDLEVGYEESTAVGITLNGSDVTINGKGAAFEDGVLTISQEGIYLVSGSLDDGQIVVDAKDTEKIQIVLNEASIHCENQAPIYIKEADKVFLTLQEGTKNSLMDGTEYELSDGESNVDGVIFSKADLTINGGGALDVTANYKHGIVSKDDLIITGGKITVTANGQGLYGKDCVKIKDGTFQLNTQGDGIQSDNAEDAQKGYIYICSGDFSITSQTDAIQAESVLRVDGGTMNLITGGGSANASTDDKGDPREGWGQWGHGGDQTEPQESTEASKDPQQDAEASGSDSAKGLKSGGELIINGGSAAIDSSDDSVHCNESVTMAGGTLNITSGDDGIHADNALTIQDGTITISKSYEGLEGQSITIQGGTIAVTASDDGVNAAGGNDSSSVSGRPGQNGFEADQNAFIRISGGKIQVNASGDGLDSNGNLYIEGGETYVSGPTDGGNGTLDYNGTAEATGGILVAAGSVGMAQGFSDSSTQHSLLYNLSSAVDANTEIVLKDANGTQIISYAPEKQYQSIVITAPQMTEGQTYQLSAGDQEADITLSSIVTSNGGGGGGMNRGGQGHMGQPPEGGQRQRPENPSGEEQSEGADASQAVPFPESPADDFGDSI